jgi:hypothetical protein
LSRSEQSVRSCLVASLPVQKMELIQQASRSILVTPVCAHLDCQMTQSQDAAKFRDQRTRV